MVFVDSNIWCYYFDQSSEEHEDVSKTLEKLTDSEEDLHINSIVLMEVGHFLVKNLGGIKGQEKLDEFLQTSLNISGLKPADARNSLEILAEKHHTGIGGRDATILNSMKEENIKKLVTHDQAFKKIEEINVIDPVEK